MEVYRDSGPDNHLRLLGEALTEVGEQFGQWRYRHLSAVRRTMGAKPGSGGSNGLAWLERSMAREVFPNSGPPAPSCERRDVCAEGIRAAGP